MKKIVITGAKGTIGTILQKELSRYPLTLLDLPEHDVRDPDILRKTFPGHDVIIHLAWNTRVDHFKSGVIDPGNTEMMLNVYKVALECGVKRVIMASSVHAHAINDGESPLLSPYDQTAPKSPYGMHKILMELLGKYYAGLGLEVVCIRFGGVNLENQPTSDPKEHWRWLSHRDAGELLRACIEKPMSEKFAVLWGMSKSAAQFYDLSNPFSWTPIDSA